MFTTKYKGSLVSNIINSKIQVCLSLYFKNKGR